MRTSDPFCEFALNLWRSFTKPYFVFLGYLRMRRLLLEQPLWAIQNPERLGVEWKGAVSRAIAPSCHEAE